MQHRALGVLSIAGLIFGGAVVAGPAQAQEIVAATVATKGGYGLSIKVSKKTISTGKRVKLTGVVKYKGKPVKGLDVTIWGESGYESPDRIAVVRTSKKGRFTIKLKPKESTKYSFNFWDDRGIYRESRPAIVKVKKWYDFTELVESTYVKRAGAYPNGLNQRVFVKGERYISALTTDGWIGRVQDERDPSGYVTSFVGKECMKLKVQVGQTMESDNGFGIRFSIAAKGKTLKSVVVPNKSTVKTMTAKLNKKTTMVTITNALTTVPKGSDFRFVDAAWLKPQIYCTAIPET